MAVIFLSVYACETIYCSRTHNVRHIAEIFDNRSDGVEVQLRPIVNDYWRVRYSPMSTLLFRSEGDRHITENYAPAIQVNCQQYETRLQCCTLSISSLID